MMEWLVERAHRGYLPLISGECCHPIRVARIARGDLTPVEKARINERAARIDTQWRGGHFNGLEYFHFRLPEEGAAMAAFILKERLHRLVPGSTCAPTAGEVEAAWRRRAEEREDVLAWARANKALMEIVQTYRFERRQGACSFDAHTAAAMMVEQLDRSIADARTYAGVCIEWAEREYRQWFWRCAPNHQVL
jgi:hypothetical protein